METTYSLNFNLKATCAGEGAQLWHDSPQRSEGSSADGGLWELGHGSRRGVGSRRPGAQMPGEG